MTASHILETAGADIAYDVRGPLDATAELLGQQAIVFPSHHGGFLGGEFGYAGQPEALARRLREVLDQD